jgi:hypothetical protein
VDVPLAAAQAWVNQLLTLPVEQALVVIAVSKRLLPNLPRIRSMASQHRKQFPLAALLSQVTLRGSRVVHTASTEEERVRASELSVYLMDRETRGMDLYQAFDRLETEQALDADTLMTFLRRGQLLDAATLGTVAVGVERYFAKDYVGAVHILVPQLEAAIRGFLPSLGLPTTSLAPDGTTWETPLDRVLETPQLCALFGEDQIAYFWHLLVDSAADNLRNETAHGLIKAPNCTRQMVQRLLHCFLLLVDYGYAQSPATGPAGDARASEDQGPASAPDAPAR